MSDSTDPRRSFLAAATGAVAGMAAAGAPASVQASNQTKRVLSISSDNRVYGKSADAFEQWGYSPAVRAGGLLFIAGVVGFRADGTVPASAAEQAELAMHRLIELLRLEGLTMADLVETVSYHVDLEQNIAAFLPIKARYFERPFPAWTLLGIAALGLPELKIEIRAIAALRS